MKQHPCITQRRVLRTVLSAAALAILAFSGSALAASVTQSGEQKNMRRVGHTDLQGRPGLPAECHQYPDGRLIAFAGTHNAKFRYPAWLYFFAEPAERQCWMSRTER